MKLSNSQRKAVLSAYKEEIHGNPLRRMYKKDEQDVIDFLFRALKILEVVPSSEEYDNEVARELDYYGCGGAPDCDYCLEAEKEQS